MKNTFVVGNAGVSTPTHELVACVLRGNGHSGTLGVDTLVENYGKVVSCDNAIMYAFFGFQLGPSHRLLSGRELKIRHFFGQQTMNPGFFRRLLGPEFAEYQSLKGKFDVEILSRRASVVETTQVDIDVIGCVGICDSRIDLNKIALKPPAMWWLGVSQKFWLCIDLDFDLIQIYESLSDLLSYKEMISEISLF